jgi:hypothetical protein
MYILKGVLWTVALFICLVGSVPTMAEENCQASMRGQFRVMDGPQLLYGGDAIVTSCDGVQITFLATGGTFEAKSAFTEKGYDSFVGNLDFIAETFLPPFPEELRVRGVFFQVFPRLEYITPDRSELALGASGVADTVVFRLREPNGEPRFMLLQFYEVSDSWIKEDERND